MAIYNDHVQKVTDSKKYGIITMGILSFAGLFYNLYTTPIHHKVFRKTLKFFGIGAAAGYGWFRFSQAKLDNVIDKIGQNILKIHEH